MASLEWGRAIAMTVHFFSKGDASVPSSRYRCFYFAEALERQGVATRVCTPPPRRFGLRIPPGGLAELARLNRELVAVGRDDLIYLQRPTHNTLFVWLVVLHQRLRRRRMVFDFCDPLFIHSPFKTALLTRAADAVVVSCEDLASYARRHNAVVHVIPNSVQPRQAATRPAPGSGRDRPVVGWIGDARVHAENLRLLLPVFRRLGGGFTFRIVGAHGADRLVGEFRSVPGLEVDVVGWLAPEDVPAQLASFDIAVLPLLDIPWNRKLVTKLVEYLAAGVAVVASPVGDNRFTLRDGDNGYLAANEEAWCARLAPLLARPALRRALAAHGLDTVRERFSLDTNGARLARMLTSLS